MQLRKSAHTVYKTQYHIVWVTRYRRKILVKGVDEYLRVKMKEVEKYYPDWEQKEVGGSGGSCSRVHGDTAKVFGEQGCRCDESKYESFVEGEVWFSEEGVLGWGRDLVERIFRVDSGNQ